MSTNIFRWLLLFIAFTQAVLAEKVLYRDLINPTNSTLLPLGGHSLLKEGVMSYLCKVPLSWDLAKGSPKAMAWLSERTDYKLTNSNYNISLNPYKVTTSIRILIWCSCVSEDAKWQQHRISDIKSAHVGHNFRKGRILAEFLKIRCANG